MKKIYPLNREENVVMLASDIVYNQKPYWCNAVARQMSFSFMSPRKYYDYDRKEVQPCIVFICGGGFEKQDRNAWTVELSYFAKRGYSVAIVDYSVLPYTRWPEQIEDVKAAIRFIRAHAKELWIDPDRIAVMGESAGGYLALLTGLTGHTDLYNVGENLDMSAAAQCVVAWWSGSGNRSKNTAPPPGISRRQGVNQTEGAPDAMDFLTKDCPPIFSVAGMNDTRAYEGTRELKGYLDAAGIENHQVYIEGAGHADAACVTTAVKEDVLAFLDKHLKQ